ncbi:hypothetical protein AK95_14500 [Paenibacillus sp. LC231]|uniref:hypothetical protein n=1 Tax=Paenibacillus sp. LC231 TaxID=1120679 RepID=UPI0008DC89F9|nr:hypothetical protein [Paenibacillus sp. LC231]OIB04824.1 hypothetical protein AK95_14500 [Paenibacillus sp. LC231]
MTPELLMEHLEQYLQEITKNILLGEHKTPPNIYKVDMPARATPDYDEGETDIKPISSTIPKERDERFPFIIIAFSDAEDNEEGFQTLQVDFIFGCEGGGRDAYMDVLHLIETVRMAFLRETYNGWPARLTLPIHRGLNQEQVVDCWMGYMSTTWEAPSMVQEVWKDGY